MKTLMTTLAALVAIAGGALPLTAYAAGNAHSAATAGMTWHGDPVSGPTSPLPQAQQAQPTEKTQAPATPANPPMIHTVPAGNSQ
ncbi:hypothetical protein [Paraburkholderia bannensis]|uniref:hypothetical protein n=1 Tax=Paraburkholderia bannensis TaxID=765414 RepID=UPI002AB27086|nr:hypothetical protein [Paraburkholderia bannensis]